MSISDDLRVTLSAHTGLPVSTPLSMVDWVSYAVRAGAELDIGSPGWSYARILEYLLRQEKLT